MFQNYIVTFRKTIGLLRERKSKGIGFLFHESSRSLWLK